MPNARINLSMRSLLKLAALVLLVAGGVGAASAAGNTGVAPQLVPYGTAAVAGNAKLPFSYEVAGYGGDGQVGANATLSGPNVLAVDAAGNVYFPDSGNSLIREVNAFTGVITTVAGQPPSACVGSICSVHTSGCSDGIAAAGNPIGGNIAGIAVDAYGNVYFSDTISESISVIYRGGTQVAAFIKLVNPLGVAASSGVQVGYIYHIAGSVNLTSCSGTASATASGSKAAVPAGDGQIAWNGGSTTATVTFGNVGPLSLDSAGNLYIGDGNPNNVVRVINTQAKAQTFFGVTVQQGTIASIVNCGSLTTLCPVGGGSTPATLANTGVGGPAGAAVFNTLATGQGAWMTTDGYGNVYELNYKGATPNINLGVAYAGGTALANLIAQANNGAGAGSTPSIANATGLKAVPGSFYYILNSITLRPSSVTVDPTGNVYYEDNHYGEIYRVDANATSSTAYYLEISYLLYQGASPTADVNRGTLNQGPTSPGVLPAPATGSAVVWQIW